MQCVSLRRREQTQTNFIERFHSSITTPKNAYFSRTSHRHVRHGAQRVLSFASVQRTANQYPDYCFHCHGRGRSILNRNTSLHFIKWNSLFSSSYSPPTFSLLGGWPKRPQFMLHALGIMPTPGVGPHSSFSCYRRSLCSSST